MPENAKRISYIDTAKGIGILIIVAGHALTNNASTREISYPHLLEFLAQFQTPLFFFLSGLVLSDKYIEHPFTGSLRKWKSIYLPWVGYNLIVALFYNVLAKWHFFSESRDTRAYLKGLLSVFYMKVQPICGAMWFIRALLLISLLFIWLRFILVHIFKLSGWKLEFATSCFVVLFFIFSLLPFCPSQFNFNAAMKNQLYFYIGYLYKKNNLNSMIAKRKTAFLISGLAINLLFAAFCTFALHGQDEFPNFLFFILTSLSGIVMIVALSQFPGLCESKLLLFLGRHTMAIMSLHFICFKIISAMIIRIYQLDWSHMEDIPVVFTDFHFLWYFAYIFAGITIPCVIRYSLDQGISLLKRDRA